MCLFLRRNGINSITKVIPGVTDDMLSAMNSIGIISGYKKGGRVYTGKNILKNHWPIISIIVVILISIVITVIRYLLQAEKIGEVRNMQKRDLIQANASLENLRQNLEMKNLAKEILLEENYNKFIRSYKFTFWFQLIGVLAGFIVPSVVFLIIFKEFIYCAFGATIGIFWMCVWLLLSMVIPPTRIYRKFAKWYRKSDVSIRDLDEIFY